MQPRWYQAQAVEATLGYLYAHRGYDPATGQPKAENPLIALPTGTGKAFVNALLVQELIRVAPATRICMATHVKELVKQNYDELLKLWPFAPVGIVSAGLKKCQTDQPITFGGIGSLIGVVEQLDFIDILLIDEAHLLSPNNATMYQKFIDALKLRSPYLRVIGLTATPWRQGQGLLTNDGIFTDIVYDLTGIDGFNRLIAEGHLCTMVTRPTNTEIDLSGVGMTAGEFNQDKLEKAVDKDTITHNALLETCQHGWQRRSWLVFATGKEHSQHCAAKLQEFGVSAGAVYDGMGDKARDNTIKAFKRGELRAIVSNNVLTTGFNHPPVDLIAMLRPTMSTGLWVQMAGRGTRPSEGKSNCLMLDFAGNIKRLGPINDPVIPKRKKPGEPGEMPVKICNSCGCYNHTRAPVCEVCGAPFEFEIKITETASSGRILASDLPEVEWLPVKMVIYSTHQKIGSTTTLKVTYGTPMGQYNEFKGFGREGFPGKSARDWWRERAGLDSQLPADAFEALQRKDELILPKKVKVWLNKKPYPEVLSFSFTEEMENAA